MSTPTAIEIVKAQTQWRRNGGSYSKPPHDWDLYNAALDTVLRDAERLKALDDAHLNPPFKGGIAVKVFDPESFSYVLHKGTLAELADRLKGAK